MFYCDIRMADLCHPLFGTGKGGTKVLQIVFGVRTWPVECSKLGKTRIIADANIRLVRNAAFLNRISICIPSEIARHDLLVLLLIIPLRVTPKGDCPFHAAAPFFAFLFLVHPDAHLV